MDIRIDYNFLTLTTAPKKNIEKLVGINREIALYSEETPINISLIDNWKQNS